MYAKESACLDSTQECEIETHINYTRIHRLDPSRPANVLPVAPSCTDALGGVGLRSRREVLVESLGIRRRLCFGRLNKD
jgi:hypothetical protein